MRRGIAGSSSGVVTQSALLTPETTKKRRLSWERIFACEPCDLGPAKHEGVVRLCLLRPLLLFADVEKPIGKIPGDFSTLA